MVTLASVSTAQHRHFLYLQSDNQQAFYLKMEGEIYSSSVSGFLILPRLQPGSVEFSIGFPRAQWPEQQFSIQIAAADKGMVLKNLPEKGWCLQDLQTAVLVQGQQKAAATSTAQQPEKVKTDDGFAVTLANAVGDQGIREVELIKKRTPDSSLNSPSPLFLAPQSQAADSMKVVDSSKALITDSMVLTSKVEKIGETRLTGFTGLLFVDQTGNEKDTVDVSFEHPLADTVIIKDTSVQIVDSAGLAISEKGTMPAVADTVRKGETKVADYLHMPATALPDRSDCRATATEKDMADLRKKAIKLGTDSLMVDFYIRELKVKCYTVAMIQALSFAFVSDATRMLFFQEAYPWVLDPSNYPTLERLFVSEPFITQFKKLINPE